MRADGAEGYEEVLSLGYSRYIGMRLAVTTMSHALGISVVGEGVETSQQLDTLAGLDCDQGQGFLLARPMLPEAVIALVG